MCMSTTVRISLEDEKRLARFARKVNARSLVEALRLALLMAEEKLDEFKGNLEALKGLLKNVRCVGGRVSERVDEELADIVYRESGEE